MAVTREQASTPWRGFLDEGLAHIEMTFWPKMPRIMLLDGPAVLGDPSRWPSQNACLEKTTQTIQSFIENRIVMSLDVEAAARLLGGGDPQRGV